MDSQERRQRNNEIGNLYQSLKESKNTWFTTGVGKRSYENDKPALLVKEAIENFNKLSVLVYGKILTDNGSVCKRNVIALLRKAAVIVCNSPIIRLKPPTRLN